MDATLAIDPVVKIFFREDALNHAQPLSRLHFSDYFCFTKWR